MVKQIRKHKGINQKTGRLNKGYKYSGKKTKSGLKIIVKKSVKKTKTRKTMKGGSKESLIQRILAQKTKEKGVAKMITSYNDYRTPTLMFSHGRHGFNTSKTIVNIKNKNTWEVALDGSAVIVNYKPKVKDNSVTRNKKERFGRMSNEDTFWMVRLSNKAYANAYTLFDSGLESEILDL